MSLVGIRTVHDRQTGRDRELPENLATAVYVIPPPATSTRSYDPSAPKEKQVFKVESRSAIKVRAQIQALEQYVGPRMGGGQAPAFLGL